ncbi:hypothetical protein LCGC14_2027740 [marine sediment metagenome]|uniref:Uncharacterized protein n=1 Tax=marine sediment metagenome TaxID=412755 RepID=A0A0F9HSN6_9ZZZZ
MDKENNADFDKFVKGIEETIIRDMKIIKKLSDKLNTDGDDSENNFIGLRGRIGGIQKISETLCENIESLSEFLAIKEVSSEDSLIIKEVEDGAKWEFADNKKNNPQPTFYHS